MLRVRVKLVRDGARLPQRRTSGSSGLDLHAAIDGPVSIPQGATVVVPTGIAIAVPLGCEGQVRSRSGLAAQHSIFVLNSPGTIDSDYRGEIQVILANLGEREFVIHPGDRIAQLVIAPVIVPDMVETEELDRTVRGSSGLGSTGVR